jgi:hypothetical protein
MEWLEQTPEALGALLALFVGVLAPFLALLADVLMKGFGFLLALLPGGIALWIAFSERRRSDRLRREDLAAAQSQRSKDAHKQLVELTHRDDRERRATELQRRRETVARLNTLLYEMSTVWDRAEVGRLIDNFAHEASYLYVGNEWSEDMHLQEWVNQMLVRYRQFSFDEPFDPEGQPGWLVESTDRTTFLANAGRRLLFWARGDLSARHLRDGFRDLLATTGMPPYIFEGAPASPWIFANPVEQKAGETINPRHQMPEAH